MVLVGDVQRGEEVELVVMLVLVLELLLMLVAEEDFVVGEDLEGDPRGIRGEGLLLEGEDGELVGEMDDFNNSERKEEVDRGMILLLVESEVMKV